MLKRLIEDVSAAGLRREACESHRRLQLGATGFLLRSTSCFRTKHLMIPRSVSCGLAGVGSLENFS